MSREWKRGFGWFGVYAVFDDTSDTVREHLDMATRSNKTTGFFLFSYFFSSATKNGFACYTFKEAWMAAMVCVYCENSDDEGYIHCLAKDIAPAIILNRLFNSNYSTLISIPHTFTHTCQQFDIAEQICIINL